MSFRSFVRCFPSFQISLAVIGLALMPAFSVSAQVATSSISGNVLDPTGAVIPAAQVTLRLPGGAMRTTLSNAIGVFRFDGLNAGLYTLRAEAPDFRGRVAEISISTGEHRIHDALLELDPALRIQERVMVMASASEALEIPGSAHYIGGEELARRKVSFDDIHKLLAPVPGVNIQEEEGFGLRPNIGMRGSGVELSAKITLMEDGVLIAPAPYAAPSAYYFPVSGRMAAIEVRKGSSQIKFGPQSNGGALNLISNSIPNSLRLAGTLSGGQHGTAKGHVRIGDSYSRFGWTLETYQITTAGFKEVDGGGRAGFKVNDYLGKMRFNTGLDARIYQEVEIKLGRTNQISNETYLGLTDEDFARAPNRRYAASQQDVFYGVHEQYQARYFAGLSPNIDLTVTAYRNSFARNWYKLQSIQGVGISSVLGDPTRYAEELQIAKGGDSAAGALRVRANNREYYSIGVGSVLGLRLRRGNVAQRFEIGLRYHEDQEDRLQHEDGFGMRDGRMVFTSAGAAGSQSNRISDAEAWAFFIEDKVEWGRWTVTPGFRYERIELIRTDYHTNDSGRTAPSRVRRNEVAVLVPGIGVTFDVSTEFTVLGGLTAGSPLRVRDRPEPRRPRKASTTKAASGGIGHSNRFNSSVSTTTTATFWGGIRSRQAAREPAICSTAERPASSASKLLPGSTSWTSWVGAFACPCLFPTRSPTPSSAAISRASSAPGAACRVVTPYPTCPATTSMSALRSKSPRGCWTCRPATWDG